MKFEDSEFVSDINDALCMGGRPLARHVPTLLQHEVAQSKLASFRSFRRQSFVRYTNPETRLKRAYKDVDPCLMHGRLEIRN